MELSREGLAFKDYAEKINYWYEAADTMFGPEGKLSHNAPVKVTADAVVADYLLPDAVATILASHPGVEFRLFTGEDVSMGLDIDVEISVSRSPETMDFERERLLVGVMDACVVASRLNRRLSEAAVLPEVPDGPRPFSTIAGIHVSNRLAVWSGYYDLLTPDLKARVCCVSTSVEHIKRVVLCSQDIAGVIPEFSCRRERAVSDLLLMPVRLPGFAFDVHFNPSVDFAGKAVCNLLRSSLSDVIRSTPAGLL